MTDLILLLIDDPSHKPYSSPIILFSCSILKRVCYYIFHFKILQRFSIGLKFSCFSSFQTLVWFFCSAFGIIVRHFSKTQTCNCISVYVKSPLWCHTSYVHEVSVWFLLNQAVALNITKGLKLTKNWRICGGHRFHFNLVHATGFYRKTQRSLLSLWLQVNSLSSLPSQVNHHRESLLSYWVSLTLYETQKTERQTKSKKQLW